MSTVYLKWKFLTIAQNKWLEISTVPNFIPPRHYKKILPSCGGCFTRVKKEKSDPLIDQS
jgi:hypothetical protein